MNKFSRWEFTNCLYITMLIALFRDCKGCIYMFMIINLKDSKAGNERNMSKEKVKENSVIIFYFRNIYIKNKKTMIHNWNIHIHVTDDINCFQWILKEKNVRLQYFEYKTRKHSSNSINYSKEKVWILCVPPREKIITFCLLICMEG